MCSECFLLNILCRVITVWRLSDWLNTWISPVGNYRVEKKNNIKETIGNWQVISLCMLCLIKCHKMLFQYILLIYFWLFSALLAWYNGLQLPGSSQLKQTSSFHFPQFRLSCTHIKSMDERRPTWSWPFVCCSILWISTGYFVILWVTSKMHSGIPSLRTMLLLIFFWKDKQQVL